MLDTIAQFNMEIRIERQMDGIRKAKERSVSFGRGKKLSNIEIIELQKKRKEGVLIETLVTEYVLSKSSIYQYLEEKILK